MKAVLVVVGVLLLGLLGLGGCGIGSYNGIVTKDEAATAAWSEIQSQYQRRYDLIPQLVETVKGAKDFEQSTLAAVVEARASVGKVTLPSNLPDDPAALKALVAAQDQLSGALSRLLVVAENYPDLKTSENFLSLQDELAGTENRINAARIAFIDRTKEYNAAIRRFPASVVAGMFGFEARAQLEVPANVTERPAIDFGGK